MNMGLMTAMLNAAIVLMLIGALVRRFRNTRRACDGSDGGFADSGSDGGGDCGGDGGGCD